MRYEADLSFSRETNLKGRARLQHAWQHPLRFNLLPQTSTPLKNLILLLLLYLFSKLTFETNCALLGGRGEGSGGVRLFSIGKEPSARMRKAVMKINRRLLGSLLPFSNVSIVEKLLFQRNTSFVQLCYLDEVRVLGIRSWKREKEDRKVVASSEASTISHRCCFNTVYRNGFT